MIVGVFPQGCDDQGRPGALAFHALFVGPWSYRTAGANPFGFASALRREWTSSDQDAVLSTGRLVLASHERERDPAVNANGLIEEIVAALRSGKKVMIPSSEPIAGLARAVWARLPGRIRRRASVATWAFGNANHFDLVAMPHFNGISADPSELVLQVSE
jgi:hypothetical protein